MTIFGTQLAWTNIGGGAGECPILYGQDRVVSVADINNDGTMDQIVERPSDPKTPFCAGSSSYVLQLQYPGSQKYLEVRGWRGGSSQIFATVESLSLQFRKDGSSPPFRRGDVASGTGRNHLTGQTETRRGRIHDVQASIDFTDSAHPKTTWTARIAGIAPEAYGLVIVDADKLTFHESADKLDGYARDILATLKRERGSQLAMARAIIRQRGSVEALANERERQKLRRIGKAVEAELNRLDKRGQLDRVAWDMVEDRIERRLGFHPRSSYLYF